MGIFGDPGSSQGLSDLVTGGAAPPVFAQPTQAAPDLSRIKGNVAKMISQGAPESDIDTYLFHERVTPDQVKMAPQPSRTVTMPTYDGMGAVTGSEEITPPIMQPSAFRDQADDITKSIGGGLVRGTAKLAGAVTDTLPNALMAGSDYIAEKITGEKRQQPTQVLFPGLRDELTPEGWQRNIEKATGPAYEPKTTAGKFANTAAEFVPGGVWGKLPNIARNAIAYGVIPGLASEAAGQVVGEGSPYEQYARLAGGLAGGFASAGALRTGASGRLLRDATEGATPQQLDRMETLMEHAARQGTPLSRAEALQYVTAGATGIGDLQHKVEGLGGMRDFYAPRPAQNQAAARNAFDTIAPPNAQPSNIGPTIGGHAENIVGDVQTAINRATRPLYQAAEAQRVGPQVHNALMTDPLYARTLQEVRNNPALNRTIENMPDDAVGVVDLVQRRLREAADNAKIPGQASTSNLAAANFQDARTAPIAAAEAVTGSRPGIQGYYESARAAQEQLRERYLQPILNGPLGKIAAKDTTTKKAIETLFPTDPLAGSQHEIGDAMTALVNRSPTTARALVRAHAEGVFNEAAQNLVSGPSQTGGAKFAAVLRGNPQQSTNLETAVRALPNGDATWTGFNRFLDIMEAQGQRQAVGSRTAFNGPVIDTLKDGGAVNTVGKLAAGGGLKLPQKVMEAVDRWNVGRNVDELSRLLTLPEAAAHFRQLATAPQTSTNAAFNFIRLANIANEGRKPARTGGSYDNRPGNR